MFNSLRLIASRCSDEAFEQPVRILDLDKIAPQYDKLQAESGYHKTHVAVKACSAPGILPILIKKDASFETASSGELDLLKAAFEEVYGEAPPQEWVKEKVIDSHPQKGDAQIIHSLENGVRTFTFQTPEAIDAFHAILEERFPEIDRDEITIMVRINTEDLAAVEEGIKSEGDVTSFSERFGVDEISAQEILTRCKIHGLNNVGTAFHTGTQQTNLEAWDYPILSSRRLKDFCESQGLNFCMVDIGGGFPAKSDDYQTYHSVISDKLAKTGLLDGTCKIIFEPGRAVSSEAGIVIGNIQDLEFTRRQTKTSVGTYNAGIYGVGHETFIFRRETGEDEFTLVVKSNPEKTEKIAAVGTACASFDKHELLGLGAEELAAMRRGDIIVMTGVGSYIGEMTTPWCTPKQLATVILPEGSTDENKVVILSTCSQWLANGRMKAGYYSFDKDGYPTHMPNHTYHLKAAGSDALTQVAERALTGVRPLTGGGASIGDGASIVDEALIGDGASIGGGGESRITAIKAAPSPAASPTITEAGTLAKAPERSGTRSP